VPSSQLTSAATIKLELLLRRYFSLLLVLSTIEVVANAISQASLLANLSWIFLGVLLLGQLALLLTSWLGQGSDFWFIGYGILSLLLLALWPLVVTVPAALPNDFQPWMWWAIGSSAVAVAIGAKPLTTLFYITVNAALWFIVDSSQFGGGSERLVSMQDSAYLFFSAGALAGLIFLIREGAQASDDANSEAIQSTLQQARTDAVERERQRIDALVHDKVLSTLLLAANAQTPVDKQSVVKQAKEAISTLAATREGTNENAGFTPLGLFHALQRAAIGLSPEIEVLIMSGGTEKIPARVAQSITEATLQAIDNANRHSRASQIKLILDSPTPNTLDFQVIDNGVGFRIDKVPKDRIGIRSSIIGRLESVNGQAVIESSPTKGTIITLRWSA
jgi:signal transduction histidine kinase